MNPYQGAISAVGRILDTYDTNKLYPVYGFGAKVRIAAVTTGTHYLIYIAMAV